MVEVIKEVELIKEVIKEVEVVKYDPAQSMKIQWLYEEIARYEAQIEDQDKKLIQQELELEELRKEVEDRKFQEAESEKDGQSKKLQNIVKEAAFKKKYEEMEKRFRF